MAPSQPCSWGLPLCILLACTCCLPLAVAQNEVISCGGFVRVSSQMEAALKDAGVEQVDLSAVRITVLSPNGVKKEEGDCSPLGYYFVPVDPGTYKVRVHAPPGWAFSPQEVQITCNQQSCNAGEDVNFELTGIDLSGHVEPGPASASCKAAAGSFNGISISVSSAADRSSKAAAVQVADSRFNIGPLLPGKYVISASHPDWQLSPAQLTHTVGLYSAQLQQPFSIAGYRLSGSVTSRSGPVSGIQVTLLSADLVKAGCSKSHPPGHVNAADIAAALSTTALCSVLSSADGQYSFPGVPCGQYTLQAQHPDTSSTFEVEPTSMTVVVGHGNAVVQEPFTVTGFSVQGRVVDSAGNGVAGVDISVAGEVRASTDLNGRYTIARMNEGRLDVTAAKKYHTFSSLTAVHVTPAAQVLPDITVKSISVCGRLAYGEQQFKVNSRRVSLTSSDGGSIAEHTAADAASAFCFTVPPGRYRVAPYVTSDEKSRGLIFSPNHADLEVSGEPVFNVVFSQAQLTISGSVVCLDGPCPGDVHVSLKSAAGKVVVSARLDEIAVKDRHSTGNSIPFQLLKVSPGRYTLAAFKASWCWHDEDGVQVLLNTTDAEAALLRQAGYQLQISSTHPVDLAIRGPAEIQPLNVHIDARSTVCLPGSGAFTITPHSCFVFGPEPHFTVTVKPTSPPEPLTLRATQVYAQGSVVVAPGTAGFPDSITINAAIDGSDAAKAMTIQATADDPKSPGVYRYALAIDLGSTVVVTPSVADDSGLLFYPRSQVFKHDAAVETCPPDVERVDAKPGKILAGATEPAVEGADVKVTFKGPSSAAGRSAGELAVQGSTDDSGTFSLGPLYDDAEYAVEVSKPGHIFTPAGEAAGQLKFTVKQLAQVTVNVELPTGAEPSAVFLSLSGSGGFKNNARLGADKTLTFFDLQPGTYYLKPLLREHQFDPPVADLVLTDGQAVEVTLTAVRTAWGISGAVKSVGGAPLAGAIVEACQGSGAAAVVLDSSVTDDAGQYRIGNLKPGSLYEVRVRLDGRVISAHPAAKQVTMERSDVPGIDFVAFRTSSRSALSAALKLPIELRNAIKAELLPATSGSAAAPAGVSPVASTAVDGSGFFELRGLKPGLYVLKLSCDPAAAGGMSCEAWEMPVQVPTKDLHLGVLPYTASPLSSSAGAAAASGAHVSDDGLDWKVPVLVVLLLIAGSATVLKPAIVDILQLRPATIAQGGAAASDTLAGFAPAQTGRSSGRAAAAAAAAEAEKAVARSAAVAAAAATALPSSGNGTSATVTADADVFEDVIEDIKGAGSKQRGAVGTRSRARRA